MSVFELWLPILAAGIAVHIASTIAWVALPHHKPEWPRLDSEKDPTGWLRERGVRPGQYFIDAQADDACGGTLVLWRQRPNMGANIGLTVSMFLWISLLIGYLASLALEPGAAPMEVFRFTFTAAFLVHVCGGVVHVIWFRRKLLMDTLDGLVYALITGGVYTLLWPAAG